jgi:hypothetical protein
LLQNVEVPQTPAGNIPQISCDIAVTTTGAGPQLIHSARQFLAPNTSATPITYAYDVLIPIAFSGIPAPGWGMVNNWEIVLTSSDANMSITEGTCIFTFSLTSF